ATALGRITGSSAQVDKLVAEIASASREQSQGIGQVNAAMGQMDKVTQSNAAGAEESAAAAEELSSQAEQLQSMIRELSQLVGGAARPAVRRMPPPPAPSPCRPRGGGFFRTAPNSYRRLFAHLNLPPLLPDTGSVAARSLRGDTAGRGSSC